MKKEYTYLEELGDNCFFIKEADRNGYIRRAEFKCRCGNHFISQINNVKAKKQISCGCEKLKRISELNKTHGHAGNNRTVEYCAYHTMLQRCYNKKDRHYQWYGARGITVCDRWRESFENFIEDMGIKPDKNLSLDRLDNDLGYSKENCKWVTHKEQCNNRRNSKKYK